MRKLRRLLILLAVMAVAGMSAGAVCTVSGANKYTLTVKWSSIDGATPVEDLVVTGIAAGTPITKALQKSDKLGGSWRNIEKYFRYDGYRMVDLKSNRFLSTVPMTDCTTKEELHSKIISANTKINKNMTLYICKEIILKEVTASVQPPAAGSRTWCRADKDNFGQLDAASQTNRPRVTVDPSAHYEVSEDQAAYWARAENFENPDEMYDPYVGGFTKGASYCANIFIEPKHGYTYSDDVEVSLTVEGAQTAKQVTEELFRVVLTSQPLQGEVNINYDANGGAFADSMGTETPPMPAVKLPATKDGDIYRLQTDAFRGLYRVNHDFDGWWTDRTGGDRIDADSSAACDGMTVYAHWKEPQGGGQEHEGDLLYSPLKNVKNVKGKKISVTWEGSYFGNGYQVRYSTKSSFKDAKVKNVKGVANTKATLTGLKKGKTYYVAVRPYSELGVYPGIGYETVAYGAWSDAKKVKVKR